MEIKSIVIAAFSLSTLNNVLTEKIVCDMSFVRRVNGQFILMCTVDYGQIHVKREETREQNYDHTQHS